MAFITSALDDEEAILMVECETTGAFSKSDLEIKPNPLMAFQNAIKLVGEAGGVIAPGISAGLESTNCEEAEVRFGVKIDAAGSVLLAMSPNNCQFQVTLKFRPKG